MEVLDAALVCPQRMGLINQAEILRGKLYGALVCRPQRLGLINQAEMADNLCLMEMLYGGLVQRMGLINLAEIADNLCLREMLYGGLVQRMGLVNQAEMADNRGWSLPDWLAEVLACVV